MREWVCLIIPATLHVEGSFNLGLLFYGKIVGNGQNKQDISLKPGRSALGRALAEKIKSC